jgi:hypothetical protein
MTRDSTFYRSSSIGVFVSSYSHIRGEACNIPIFCQEQWLGYSRDLAVVFNIDYETCCPMTIKRHKVCCFGLDFADVFLDVLQQDCCILYCFVADSVGIMALTKNLIWSLDPVLQFHPKSSKDRDRFSGLDR